jgi:hypothetical protein
MADTLYPRFALPRLKEALGDTPVVLIHGPSGVVLYDGETSAGFGEGMYAVPIRALWEKAP